MSDGTFQRPTVNTRFFFTGNQKFYLQGVTYGPFRPRETDGPFLGTPDETRRDFELIRKGGFNLLRLYHSPPSWFMDMARDFELRVLITVPWNRRVLFLDDSKVRKEIRQSVRQAAHQHRGHSALFGFYVDNEIPSDLVRWYGPKKVGRFLDELVEIVKSQDDRALAAYANFPPTEYLLPQRVDFYSYNVYLHNREEFEAYLARLHNLAEEKPLVLGEFGMDTIRHPQQEQANLLEQHYEGVFRGGLAGTIVFSWTDEWFTDGVDVEDWAFGIVDKTRAPKEAFHRISKKTIRPHEHITDRYPLPEWPRVSVVVCSYNGAKTLKECLLSLERMNYPDYEVILVDDGSTDDTPKITAEFQGRNTQIIRQENKGLSVARNTGIKASSGAIIAFTDSDCMADRDWLYHLVQTLQSGDYAAAGGPNISPPAVNWIQATVAAAPGSPCHVLISDREAEHVPGCNMAFHRWALDLIDGFDPDYRKAGDDVDVCWKLLKLGHKIAFSPSAIVLHHRRFTVSAYFNQQKGYGEAEALLRFDHVNYFDDIGVIRWKGMIYGKHRWDNLLHRPLIYHGIFGTGLFQSVYPQFQQQWTYVALSFEWNIVMAFIFILSPMASFLRIVPLIMAAITLMAALVSTSQSRLEPKFDLVRSRILLLYLAWAQPIVRGWARYITWVRHKQTPESVASSEEKNPHKSVSISKAGSLSFWSEKGGERTDLLSAVETLLAKEGWKFRLDTGWTDWDILVFANRWWHIRLRTLTEIYPHGRRLNRVNLELLPSTVSLLIGAILVILGILISLATPLKPQPLLMGSISIVILFLVGLKGLLVRRRVADLVAAAARSVELIPVLSKSSSPADSDPS